MLLNPAEGCVQCVCRYPFACAHVTVCVLHMVMSICMYHVHLPCQQASGPLVNLIEFMDQQELFPTLSGSLVIELNYHFDTCRKSTKSPGCSDYFAGTLHVMTSMAERLPKLVHHADRSPQTAQTLLCKSLVTYTMYHITVVPNPMKYFTLSVIQIFPINSGKCIRFHQFLIK